MCIVFCFSSWYRQSVLPGFKIGRGAILTYLWWDCCWKFVVTANQATRSFGLPLASPFLSRERASWRAHRYKILNLVISSKGRLPRIIIMWSANYRDVFILLTFFFFFFFFWWGLPKMEIWNFEKYELSLRFNTFGMISKNKLDWRFYSLKEKTKNLI